MAGSSSSVSHNNINAGGRSGVHRSTSLPLWSGEEGGGGYLPLILPLASRPCCVLKSSVLYDVVGV